MKNYLSLHKNTKSIVVFISFNNNSLITIDDIIKSH